MTMIDRTIFGFRRAAGVAFAALTIAAVSAPTSVQAQTYPYHGHIRGHVGPWYGPGRFHGRFAPAYGWYGAWPYYPGPYPAYGYVRYYYPQYYYPAYVLPTAVYAAPPRPVVAPAPRPREFTVYFDFDQYALTPDGERVVDAAIASARNGGPARIVVIGNTDLAGTNGYNQVLSRRRADTVRSYMVAGGVNPADIGIEARGKSTPAVRTADGVREPRNRRVEIVIEPRYRQRPPATSTARPPYIPAATAPAPPPPVGAPTNLVNP